MEKPTREQHPFPTEQLNLIMDLNESSELSIEEIACFSQIIHKYCQLREYVFRQES